MKKSQPSIVEEAKANVAARQAEENAIKKEASRGWVKNAFLWLLDSISIVIILALAVLGAQSLLGENMGEVTKLGAAILFVGITAARPLERRR